MNVEHNWLKPLMLGDAPHFSLVDSARHHVDLATAQALFLCVQWMALTALTPSTVGTVDYRLVFHCLSTLATQNLGYNKSPKFFFNIMHTKADLLAYSVVIPIQIGQIHEWRRLTQVGLLQTAHYWDNTVVLLGVCMRPG